MQVDTEKVSKFSETHNIESVPTCLIYLKSKIKVTFYFVTLTIILNTFNVLYIIKFIKNVSPFSELFHDCVLAFLDIRLRGGGGHPVFFMKLDFEIAVDQQTNAHDQTFEGVPDSGCPPVPAGQPRPYLVNFWLNFAKSL